MATTKGFNTMRSSMTDVDFDFYYPDEKSLAWCIRILSGEYRGLIVRYMDAKVERDDLNRNRLSFQYEVVERCPGHGVVEPDLSNANPQLVHILGNILAKIVLAIAEDKASNKPTPT